MWTLLTGSILSSIFENQTVKLFEDFSSSNYGGNKNKQFHFIPRKMKNPKKIN